MATGAGEIVDLCGAGGVRVGFGEWLGLVKAGDGVVDGVAGGGRLGF